jgi:hypothetical protein
LTGKTTTDFSLEEAEGLIRDKFLSNGIFLSGAENGGNHLDEALAGEHELSSGDVVVLGDVSLRKGLILGSIYKIV